MNSIKYGYSEDERSIILPQGAPFDGKDYLIKFAEGWVEARWIGIEYSDDMFDNDTAGFEWCCLDDEFQKQLDEAHGWLPLPTDDTVMMPRVLPNQVGRSGLNRVMYMFPVPMRNRDNRVVHQAIIPWAKIKQIYALAVKNLGDKC